MRTYGKALLNGAVRAGGCTKAFRTAIGRAILAFLSQAEFQKLLERILEDGEAVQYCGSVGAFMSREVSMFCKD